MEVKNVFRFFLLIGILSSCSNTPDFETGEIKTYQLIMTAIASSKNSNQIVDSRKLLSRAQIDRSKIPILYVELESGQNGTLTQYPGKGIGQTWLGADGATITLNRGVLKSSRGMGDDLMGSNSSMPLWSELKNDNKTYIRKLSYLGGDNKIQSKVLICNIGKQSKNTTLKIWEVDFKVRKFEENCSSNSLIVKNIYYLDNSGIVRKSQQFHSETLGYLITERLDR